MKDTSAERDDILHLWPCPGRIRPAGVHGQDAGTEGDAPCGCPPVEVSVNVVAVLVNANRVGEAISLKPPIDVDARRDRGAHPAMRRSGVAKTRRTSF